MSVIGLIVTDLERTRLGLAARLGDRLGDRAVLGHTVRRMAAVPSVERIVLVHPSGQDPAAALGEARVGKPIATHADPNGLRDADTARWRAARKWALTAWRGGLGSASVFDELLPPGPLVETMAAHDAEAALIVGADWCLFDPSLGEAALKLHREAPEAMKIAFTQAPPGLAGVATSRAVLADFHAHRAAFAHALGYQPKAPTPDPIGRDANVPIPPAVRNCNRRFIYDTARGAALIGAVARRLGDRFEAAGAVEVVEACRAIEADEPDLPFRRLPQQVTLELTPRRPVRGSITPQHHVRFDRPDLDVDLGRRIIAQLDGAGGNGGGAAAKRGSDREANVSSPGFGSDVALLLGGLGDALEHPAWDELVEAAVEAGVLGIGIETDLLCDDATLDRLIELPIDVIAVRINAGRAETYRRVMGVDGFVRVMENLQRLYDGRKARASGVGAGEVGVPWLVPRMVKTGETLGDLEGFFDRWTMLLGHAVVEPARCGCGLMPELSPVSMTPPAREPCAQLGRRMSVLSDGTVALCDQDWQGRGALGDAKIESLADVWRKASGVAAAHREGRYAELTLCGSCGEWHRP